MKSFRPGDVVRFELPDGSTETGVIISWRSRFGGFYDIMIEDCPDTHRQHMGKIEKTDIPNVFSYFSTSHSESE